MSNIKHSLSNTKQIDTRWIFTLFGTAIGAGLLYLPAQAGQSGFWALLTVLILAYPLTYFSHKNMANIVIGSDKGGITHIFTNNLGKTIGIICVLLYFFAIFLNMPMYSIGLNNELGNLLQHYNITQSNLADNPLFSLSILAVLFVVVSLGIDPILRIMQYIVIFLIIQVLILSIYIIPFWNANYILNAHFEPLSYIIGVLMILPVLVLSMNHSPVISSLVMFYRENLNQNKSQEKEKVYKIIRINCVIMLIFVIFFVMSCLLSTTSAEVNKATANNLSIVTLIQERHHSDLLHIISPMIVFTAIISSFIGCYIGSREALKFLFRYFANNVLNKEVKDHSLNRICIILIFSVLWIVTIFNFKILDIIGILVAPTVAFLLFVLPVIIIYKNISYKEFRKKMLSITLVIMGLVIIFGYVIGLMLS